MDIFTGTQSIKIYRLFGIVLLSLCLIGNEAFCADEDAIRVDYVQSITEMSLFKSEHSLWRRLGKFVGKNSRPALRQPLGLDARNGMLAIADASLGGVYFIDFSGETVKFICNENGEESRIPVDAAIADQKIFVTYSNSPAIDVFQFTGELLQTITVKSSATRFSGIAWGGSSLFVVDTPHHTVFQIDEAGQILKKFQRDGNIVRLLNYPTFVTVDNDQSLLISDTMNFQILTFAIMGDKISSFGTSGVDPGQFNRPKGVAVDQNGNIYVVDSSFDNVQVFDPTGRLLTFFGGNGFELSQFRMPTDIAIDGDKLYISDTLNRRVQVFQIYDE